MIIRQTVYVTCKARPLRQLRGKTAFETIPDIIVSLLARDIIAPTVTKVQDV